MEHYIGNPAVYWQLLQKIFSSLLHLLPSSHKILFFLRLREAKSFHTELALFIYCPGDILSCSQPASGN